MPIIMFRLRLLNMIMIILLYEIMGAIFILIWSVKLRFQVTML
jgi:hypothetical protein